MPSTLWSGAGRVFVGRDTRASGVELEQAFARGVVSAGGMAVLGGVLPTPAVALASLDLGVVISASHNPPEYNGVKFFDSRGHKLPDAAEEEIEALLDAQPAGRAGRGRARPPASAEAYLDYVLDHFGVRSRRPADRGRLRATAPTPGSRRRRSSGSARRSTRSATRRTARTSTSAAARPTSTALERARHQLGGYDLGIAFDGDGDRVLAVDERGEVVDGDGIVAILALDLGVDLVAVTQMTNHGFHRLMAERGIRVVTTDVGDRYVLEALWREGGVLGGEQSGHVIYLRDHVTGDGLAAALLLCARAARPQPERGRRRDAALRAGEGERPRRLARADADAIRAEVERVNAELDGDGRVLVRPSGTEPLVRVLVEAEDARVAETACASIAALVQRELG